MSLVFLSHIKTDGTCPKCLASISASNKDLERMHNSAKGYVRFTCPKCKSGIVLDTDMHGDVVFWSYPENEKGDVE